MMLDAIKNRRSVRFYRDEPVEDEQIEEVLKAGFCAPSAHAGRPWHVVVIRDREKLGVLAGIHRWTRFLAKAPVAIVVCIDLSLQNHFWPEDGAAFLENMLIQATELGLGSCWVGIRDTLEDGKDGEKIVRELCGIPDHFGIEALAALGHSARYPGPHDPRIPQGRVHIEKYMED